MYFEEKVINGVLHARNTPDGEWIPLSPELLTTLLEAERRVVAHRPGNRRCAYKWRTKR